MTLTVELVSPERVLWSGEAEMVTARTAGGGDIAFLSGHVPFVGALEVGKVIVRPPSGPDEVIAVHAGFIEVSDDRVTILSDIAEIASEIDVQRAQAARERAEDALRQEHDAVMEAALRRANVRLDVAGAGSVAH